MIYNFIQFQIYQSISHLDSIPKVKSTEVILPCASQEFLNFVSFRSPRQLIFEAHRFEFAINQLMDYWIVSMQSVLEKKWYMLEYSIVYFILHKQTFVEWFSKYLLRNVCRNSVSAKTSFIKKSEVVLLKIQFSKLLKVQRS